VTPVSVIDRARRPSGACGAVCAAPVAIVAAADRRPRASTARTDRRCGAARLIATVARVPATWRTVVPSR
jgi:hypothetical protein